MIATLQMIFRVLYSDWPNFVSLRDEQRQLFPRNYLIHSLCHLNCHIQETSQNASLWLCLSSTDTITLNGPLMFRNCFINFAVEYQFASHATEPGYARVIATIEIWLIDWLSVISIARLANEQSIPLCIHAQKRWQGLTWLDILQDILLLYSCINYYKTYTIIKYVHIEYDEVYSYSILPQKSCTSINQFPHINICTFIMYRSRYVEMLTLHCRKWPSYFILCQF